jgi:flagellar protein FliO/FliZ
VNTAGVPGFDFAGLLEMLLSLVLVVGLIIALSWVIGRLCGVTRSTSGAIGVLAEVAVGPKERIVLVRVGARQALVGVSSAGIQSLDLLEQNIEVPEAARADDFSAKLKEVMKRAGIAK